MLYLEDRDDDSGRPTLRAGAADMANSTARFTGPGKRARKSKTASIQNPGAISPPAKGTRTAAKGRQPSHRATKAKSPSPTAGVVRVSTNISAKPGARATESKRPGPRKSPRVRA
jgi:hypothetical protein